MTDYADKVRELRVAKQRLARAQDDVDRLERELFPVHHRPLTKRQERILLILWEAHQRHDPMPTLREIGMSTGIRSTNGVNDHLMALERKGYIHERKPSQARGIRLTEKAVEHFSDEGNAA